jgi:hypothetical protein
MLLASTPSHWADNHECHKALEFLPDTRFKTCVILLQALEIFVPIQDSRLV